MDGLTAKVYHGVKRYWRTRGYHRLGTTTVHGDHAEEQSQPRQQRGRRRRVWRIRRLKLKLPRSPRKLFVALRDAYVRVMMKLASTSVVRGRTVPGFSGDGFGKTMMIKGYDEKIVVEICKNLAIRHNHQHQISSQIACSG